MERKRRKEVIKDKKITIRLSPEEKMNLEMLVSSENTTISKFIRGLLLNQLNQNI